MDDFETFKRLIKEHKKEEAEALIAKMIAACRGPDEVKGLEEKVREFRGEELCALIEESNRVDRDYLTDLEETLARLRKLDDPEYREQVKLEYRQQLRQEDESRWQEHIAQWEKRMPACAGIRRAILKLSLIPFAWRVKIVDDFAGWPRPTFWK
jgi:hypothetical protein